MGFIDRAKQEAQKAVATYGPKVQEGLDRATVEAHRATQKHGGKIQQGIDRAAAAADQRTGGKYGSRIETVRGKAHQGFDAASARLDESAGRARNTRRPGPASGERRGPGGSRPYDPGTRPGTEYPVD